MRKKFTMLLTALLCCVGVAKAETGDVIDISNGYYTVQCNGDNRFANYNGDGRIVPMNMGRFPTSTYLFTQGENGAYTIQTSDKKFVTYKGTGTGDQLAIVDESSANDKNKWWVVREGTSEGTITIVPKQDNIGEKTPGWNYAVNFNGANGALGLWNCDDSNSQWLLKPAAVMAEGQAYIKCGGNYITFISEGANGAYLGKTQDKNVASTFTITPGNDGKYTIQLGEQFIVNNGGVTVVSADRATDDNKWWVIAPNVTTEKSTGTEVDIIAASQNNIGRTTNAWNSSDHTNGSNSGLGFYGASDGGSKCEIEWIPITITYKYKFNDVEKYSETIEGCYIGHPYPAPTVELPFGVSIGNLPEGTITAENTTVDINLSVNLPFEYADKYESIDNWYYIQMHSSGGRYIQAMADHIEWLDVDMNVAEADSYTWGFVGNPLDGFKLVNKSTGETKAVNSNGEGNPALGDINTATSWTIKPSGTNPEAQYFCFQHPGNNNYMNAQNGKIAFWSDADQGSTMWVTERDLSGATELKALIESANAKVAALGESTSVGSVTRESLAELEKEIAKAQAAADAKENCIAAQIKLQAALDALVTIQPEIGKFYTIVSACSKDNDARNGQSVYVNDEGGLNFSNEGKVSKWFQFVPSGDPGKFYLYNVKSEKYLSTAKAHNEGQEEAKATSTTDGAVKVTITNMGKDNIVKIVPEGGAMIHAQTSGSKVVAWDNTAYDEASAWTLVEVENPGVAIVGDESYATLAEAIADVEENGVVKLIADVNASEIITINKAITLDGNGKTLTSTAGRAFNIETECKVVINNLTVKAGERAFNIINKPAIVELNGVTATANNNAVMIATTAGAAEVSINDCNFTGLAVVNVAGAESNVAIKNSTITNVDANEGENYGAITVWSSAKAAVVNVENTEINVAGDSMEAYVFPSDAIVNGVELVGYIVATIGDGGYETLANAIGSAKGGDVITLVRDITASAAIVINKSITLDGNGKTITYTGSDRAIDVPANADAKVNVTIENLTVDCTASYCQRGINYNEDGKLTLEGVTVKGKNVTYALNLPGSSDKCEVAINNSSLTGNIALNVWGENSTINAENTTFTAVDNNTVEGYAAVKLNNDGTTSAEGSVITITGGKIDVTGSACTDTEATSNGTSTGKINISDSTVVNGENAEMVAVIRYADGNSYSFMTIEDAIAKAQAGEKVTLLRDITASEIITIDKAITLDGNGKTLTSTATGSNARAINVSGEAANGVTIKNLTIDAKGERAINIIQKATNVTIENVTATAANYTVNVASSAPSAVVTITNSTLSGLCTVNVSAAEAKVTVENSTVNCNDNNTTQGEAYAALCLNKEAVGGSIVATNSTINVTDGSDSEKGRNGAENGTVTINGATEGVAVMVAVITYEGSNYYHSFATLEKAIEFAKAGDAITLIRDIEVSEIITIDKAITLDGNGKTLTATGCEFPIAVSQSTKVNVVNCNLTYTRKFAKVDTWYALYVPFAIELTDDFLTKYDVAEFSKMATESMTIAMVEEARLTANTPYFIRVKDEAAKTLEITVKGAEFNASPTNLDDVATLNGVYTETEASSIEGAYAMSSGAFKQAAESTQTLKPFRFYLMFDKSSSVAALRTISINVDGEEGTTAIDNSIFTNGETVVYDLQGRRVENPTKGIYIVNGKKQIFK